MHLTVRLKSNKIVRSGDAEDIYLPDVFKTTIVPVTGQRSLFVGLIILSN